MRRLLPTAARSSPPIFAMKCSQTQPTEGDHILVYLSFGFDDFIEQLKQFPNETFRVYGYDREAQDGNCDYRPFSKEGFMNDLAQQSRDGHGRVYPDERGALARNHARLPMAGQFEQQLNGYCLEQMGPGKNAPDPRRKPWAISFRLPEYRAALPNGRDNTTILINWMNLADDCALAREFHQP